MKKIEGRVLAYQLAKEIEPKDLDEVSGGSVRVTVQPTGDISNPDGSSDVSVDW